MNSYRQKNYLKGKKLCTMYYFPEEAEKDCGRFPVTPDQNSI